MRSVSARTNVSLLVASVLLLVSLCSGCAPEQGSDGGATVGGGRVITYADFTWDSARIHNRIVANILEDGYGYRSDYVAGEEPVLWEALKLGEVDIIMETWTQNIQEIYDDVVLNGPGEDLGSNYLDNWQGLLVPTYVVKGDPARGIAPMAPDLRSVVDLPAYWELFRDPESPDKGRLFSCPPGSGCGTVNSGKMIAYGLNETYNLVEASYTAELATLMGAYERGEAWLGYYWEPSWVIGQLDMTKIEEPAYDSALFTEEAKWACAYPPNDVNILVHESFLTDEPVVVDLLRKYETTADQNNKALGYMQSTGADWDEAAAWFMREYESVWTPWVPADVAVKVKAALPEVP